VYKKKALSSTSRRIDKRGTRRIYYTVAGTNTFDTDAMTREEIIETLSQVLDTVHEIVQAHENEPGVLEQNDLFDLEEAIAGAAELLERIGSAASNR
jgi:hypothetical protein